MTTRDAGALARELRECFDTRRFDQADELHTPDFFGHPLGAGFEAGKAAWCRLVDHGKVAVRSSVEGVPTSDGGARPVLIDIFRVEGGQFAEAWEPPKGSPLEVLHTDDVAG